MPFFSVIVPTYNRAALISAALDSVFAQEFTDYEVIVSDDGSADETSALVKLYGERLTYLRQENRGPGAARNLAISHARGKYVTFLDSDDLWFPWTLATHRRVIDQFHQPTIISGTEVRFRNELELKNRPKETAFQAVAFNDYYQSAFPVPPHILPGEVAIRTDKLREAGGFTDRKINSEDSDLWLKLGTTPGYVRFTAPVILGYRDHPNTAISNQERAYQGCQFMIEQERKGQYPGGLERRRERLQIMTNHLRPASLGFLKTRQPAYAWRLYRDSLFWNAQLGRLRYLAGFPLVAVRNSLRSSPRA